MTPTPRRINGSSRSIPTVKPPAVFPAAIATDANLLIGGNRVITTLATSITAYDTAITVVDASAIVENMALSFEQDGEIVTVTGPVFGSTMAVGRGFDSTAVVAHAAGSPVLGNIIAWHHNALVSEIEAIEAALGANLGNVAQTPWRSDINGAGFRLLNTGYVGIQTAAPQSALEVNGLVRSTGFGVSPASGACVEFYYDAATVAGGTGAIDAFDYTAGVFKELTIDGLPVIFNPTSDGNVGIGRVFPAYRLDINGDCNITGTYRVNGNPLASNQTPWLSDIEAAGFTLLNVSQVWSGNTTADAVVTDSTQLVFSTVSSARWAWQKYGLESIGNLGSNLNLLRCNDAGATMNAVLTMIRSTGLVGLNNPNPAYQLDIVGNCNITGEYLVNGVPITGGGGGGGNQTPWLSDINAAGFTLRNAGGVVVGNAAADNVSVDSVQVIWSTMALPRWTWQKFGTESGTNSGSNLNLIRLSDTGAILPPAVMTMLRATGYVGIGTAGPQATLHVQGANQSTSAIDTTNLAGCILADDSVSAANAGGTIVFSAAGSALRFAAIKGLLEDGTANSKGDLAFCIRLNTSDATLTEVMRIEQNGYVGINAAAPQSALEVNGLVRSTGFGVNPASGACVEFYYDAATVAGGTGAIDAFDYTAGVFKELTIDGLPVIFNPTSDGNVGIGRVFPAYRLDVNGDCNITGTYRINGVPISAGGGSQWTDTAGGIYYGNMVGIGNNSSAPQGVLDINTSPSPGGWVYIRSDVAASNPSAAIQNGLMIAYNGFNNQDVQILYGTAGTGPRLYIGRWSGAARSLDMTFGNNGNVGIGAGAINPLYQFQVFTDSAAKPTTNTWTIPSDPRTKRNTRKFGGGLDIINALEPEVAEYNGKAYTPAGTRVVSLDPEKLRKLVPAAVSSVRGKLDAADAEDTDILGVNTHEIFYHLILAVQQLGAELTALRLRKPS